MKPKDLELNAVLDRHLRKLIHEFGLNQALESGDLKCPFCGRTLTFENVGAIQVLDDVPRLICDDYSCLLDAENNG